jgi:nitroreductase
MEVYAGKESAEVLEYLLKRRSVMAAKIGGRGPNAQELEQILSAAARVPDHGKLCPFYFMVFEGDARAQAGEVIADAFIDMCPGIAQDRIEVERNRFMRAPLVVGIVARARPSKNPLWEQVLTAGAAAQNFSLAAHALGFAVQWLTEWYAYEDAVKAGLGLDKRDEIVGFMYVGEAQEQPSDRDRPDLSEIVTHWTPDLALKKGDVYDRAKFNMPEKGFGLK